MDDPELYRAFIHLNGIDKAEEVKVALVTLQKVPAGMPSSFTLCAPWQKKNEKSTFNQDVYDALSSFCKEDDQLVFVNSVVDGLGGDSSIVSDISVHCCWEIGLHHASQILTIT